MFDISESGKEIGEKLFILLSTKQQQELKQFIMDIVYEFLCKQFEVSLGIDGPNELKPVDKVAVRRAEFDNQIFELQEEKRKLYEALVIKQIDVNLYKEQKALIEQRLLEVENTKAVVMTRLEAEQQEKERQHQQKDVLQSLVENKGLTSELVDMVHAVLEMDAVLFDGKGVGKGQQLDGLQNVGDLFGQAGGNIFLDVLQDALFDLALVLHRAVQRVQRAVDTF